MVKRYKQTINISTGEDIREEITGAELTEIENEKASVDTKAKKLDAIKFNRLEILQETDWWVARGNMTAEQTAWRKSLRDIPANFTTEEEYDLLLATEQDETKDNFGHLTHEIWSKP